MRIQQWSDANTTNANQENAGHRRKRHESDLLQFVAFQISITFFE